MATQVETLGDALVLDTFKHPGGLKAAYAKIHRTVGPVYGSINTFRKFLSIDNAEQLDEKDRFRLWLLLSAYEKDPSDYGVSDDDVPSHIDAEKLAKALVHPPGLEPGTHWLRVNESAAPFKPSFARPGSSRPRTRAA